MNVFDQFVKHELKIKHYARYTDDFVILAESDERFDDLLTQITIFLRERLQLRLHPHKVTVRKLTQGIDFLGYVIRPYHILPRTKTRKRLVRKLKERVEAYKRGDIEEITLEQSLQSYLGLLSHANTYRFSEKLQNDVWFWMGS